MKRERQCPTCGDGPARVRTSYRKGSVQIRYLECRRGHSFKREADAGDIQRRQRKPPFDPPPPIDPNNLPPRL
jgi:hypothetical protein